MADVTIERIFKGPGFAETLFLGIRDGRRIIRKAANPDALPFSRAALAREIRLLTTLPSGLAPCFPEVLDTNLGDWDEFAGDTSAGLFYDMPYYAPGDGWVTLSAFFLENPDCSEEARRALDSVLDIAALYLRCDCCVPSPEYVGRTYLDAIRGSIEWAWSDPDFRDILSIDDPVVTGRRVSNIPSLMDVFEDTNAISRLLTPRYDRFLHGDFFPENILYNRRTGQIILLDPVSVRGIHRGDFALDLNKMDDWLSGELPALRRGLFTLTVAGSTIDFTVHADAGDLADLRCLGLSGRYRERLRGDPFAGMFAEEPGWERRWWFVKAFYCLCMLPLAPKPNSFARYFLALKAMDCFVNDAPLEW